VEVIFDPFLSSGFAVYAAKATTFSSSCFIFRDPGPLRAIDKMLIRIL
jgi:hypothetical protein